MWDRLLLAGWNSTANTWNKTETICSSCSSPFSVKICMPKQIPKRGTPCATASLITATKPLRSSSAWLLDKHPHQVKSNHLHLGFFLYRQTTLQSHQSFKGTQNIGGIPRIVINDDNHSIPFVEFTP